MPRSDGRGIAILKKQEVGWSKLKIFPKPNSDESTQFEAIFLL